jgi:peptidoglycan-associated lipoprotein
MPDDVNGKKAMQSCALAGEWKANPLKFKVENLNSINTDQSDYAPFVGAKGLYLSSTRKEAQGSEVFEWTGQKCADIFQSNINENSFGTVTKPNGLINSNYNEGVAWIDSTNTTMYYINVYGGNASAIRIAGDTAVPGVNALEFQMSGLGVQAVIGSGFGVITWRWNINQLV